jgi:hypothetical protein
MQSSTLGCCRVPFLTLGLVVEVLVVVEVLPAAAAFCFLSVFPTPVCMYRYQIENPTRCVGR